MTGLVNLITDHSSKLNILPIVVLMNVAIAILIHFLTKKKITKYLPSLVLGIGAIFVLIISMQNFTSSRGLNLAWIAVFLGCAALVGVFACFIIDLLHSIRKTSVAIEDSAPKATKPSRSKNVKVDPPKKVNKNKKTDEGDGKVRVAKKRNRSAKPKESPSKYNTSKITLNKDSKKVSASKVDSKDDKKLTFESDSEEI